MCMPRPVVRASIHRTQALHTHVNGHHSRGDVVPASYCDHYRRTFCSSCHKSYSRSRSHNCISTSPTTSSGDPETQGPTSSAEPSEVSLPTIPEFEEILAIRPSLCRHIPKMCRDLLAEALTNLCTQAARSPQDPLPFKLLFLFPRAVLRAPSRAGKRNRTQFARQLSDRLRRWLSGDFNGLWKEALTNSERRRDPPTSEKDPWVTSVGPLREQKP